MAAGHVCFAELPEQCLFLSKCKSVPWNCSADLWLFAGMSPYDLLAREMVNELDAVVLSVE